MRKRICLIFVLALMATGCASEVTVSRERGPISLGDKIFVDVQFDEARPGPVFREELEAVGFSVADTKADAAYLLSGTYKAMWDLVHYKLLSGYFTITEVKTGQVVMLLKSGDTGMASAEKGVHKLVKDMVRENKK